MKRHLAFEDNADLDNLDTDQRVGDDSPAPEDTPSDSDDGDNQEVTSDDIADKPLVIPDVKDLAVTELAGMLKEQDHKDNDQVLQAVAEDGQVVLKHLDQALEHFRAACQARTSQPLGYAAEELAQAQAFAGVGVPHVIDMRNTTGALSDATIATAMEGLGSTVSTVIKAIIAAIRKALAFLKQFFKDVWRHLRALDAAIKKRGDELVQFRKRYRKQLLAAGEAQGVKYEQYVQLGRHKPFLCIGGEVPNDEKAGYGFQLKGLNALMASALAYEKLITPFVPACEKLLEDVKDSSDGNITAGDIEAFFKDVPSFGSLMAKANFSPAELAHGLQPTDETTLMISDEFLGNFFQAIYLPNGDFAQSSPTVVEKLAVCKIEFTRDEALTMTDDYMRELKSDEIEEAQKNAVEQAQLLISMQRVGDMVEHRLEQLTELLKKVDAQVWHNNQGDAAVAAAKNQQLIILTRAVSAVEGSCHRFFTEVGSHVRSVQYAWYAYLTANLKRDVEILRQGMAAAKAAA